MNAIFPEINYEFFRQLHPRDIIQFAAANTKNWNLLQQPTIYNRLGIEYGLLPADSKFDSFDQFLDVVNAKYSIKGCRKLFKPNQCFYRALAFGRIDTAEKILQYMSLNMQKPVEGHSGNLQDGQISLDTQVKRSFLSGDVVCVKWALKIYEKYVHGKIYHNHLYRLMFISSIKSGSIKLLQFVLDYTSSIDIGLDVKVNVYEVLAYALKSSEMLKYIIHHLPEESLTERSSISISQLKTEYGEPLNWNDMELVEALYNESLLLNYLPQAEYFLGILNKNQYQPKIYLNLIPLNISLYDRFQREIENVLSDDGEKYIEFAKHLRDLEPFEVLPIIDAFVGFITDVPERYKRYIDRLGIFILSVVQNGDIYIANYVLKLTKIDEDILDSAFRSEYFEDDPKIPSPTVLKWFSEHGKDRELYDLKLTKIMKFQHNHYNDIEGVVTSYLIAYNVSSTDITNSILEFEDEDDEDLFPHDEILELTINPKFDPKIEHDRISKIFKRFDIPLDDPRFQDNPNPLVKIHKQNKLTLKERYLQMIQLRSFYNEFEHYYLMSDEELANELNKIKFSVIPHFNHLAVALYLSEHNLSDLRGVVPESTLNQIKAIEKLSS